MVSTYLSYDLVVRDIKSSMNRVANETQVKRDSEYYKENIGKVTSIEEFLDDYRLYSYAMKAYGLEDMTYAKAFMEKVLESDLSDEDSYANKLSDTRYRQFAAAYQFGTGTKIPQTESQRDELIGLYTARIESLDEQITAETNYYNAMLTRVTNVDEFLANPRLREYMFQAYDIDGSTYDRTLMRNLLTSNLDDPASYFNTVILPKVVEERDRIEANSPTLTKIDQRAAYLADIEGLESSIDDITTIRQEIGAKLTQMAEPGADVSKLQDDIDKLQRQEEAIFTDFVTGKIADLNAQIPVLVAKKGEPGADVAAIQAQIDAINLDITHWTTDQTSRNSIATKKSEIDSLKTQMAETGADTAALQAQIDAKQAEIATLQAGLEPLDTDDIQQMIDERQVAVDELSVDLPAVGEETDALRAKIVAQNTSAGTYLAAAAKYEVIVSAYQFNGDGSVPAGGFQSEEKRQETTTNYVYKQDRLTTAGAMLNDEYFRNTINTYTTLDEVMADARIVEYLKSAFGLSTYNAIVNSTLENSILTPATEADLEDEENYLVKFYEKRPYFNNLVELSRAFNFDEDGNLPAGMLPIDPEKLAGISGGYFSGYNDVAEAADEKAISALKASLNSFNSEDGKIANVTDLVNNASIYDFAMAAVGLDTDEVSKRIMKKVLSSDLQDPKSFVYTLKDERYVTFAKMFNFDTDGNLTWARMAQSEDTLQATAKDYIVQKTRFLKDDELEQAKEDAEAESEYYQEKIATIANEKELLADRRLVDFILVAKGIDPKNVTDEYMQQIFDSDLTDPESFANSETDYRFAELAASFNFDAEGNVIRLPSDTIQSAGEIMETLNLYVRQSIETTQGEENNGVRLALYFERMASTITSAYDILGDTALLEFFRTTYGLPTEISSMDVDQQAKIVEKNLTLTDLQDPEALKKILNRFTIMYDLENNTTTSPAVTLMSGGSGGISADLMLSISQLRAS